MMAVRANFAIPTPSFCYLQSRAAKGTDGLTSAEAFKETTARNSSQQDQPGLVIADFPR